MAEIKITGNTQSAIQSINQLNGAVKNVNKTEEEMWREEAEQQKIKAEQEVKKKKWLQEQGYLIKKVTEDVKEQGNKWTELASKINIMGKIKDAFGWVKDNVQAMESLQTQFTALSLFDESGKFRKVLNESIVITKGVANEYDLIAKTNELVQQGFEFTEEQFRDLIDVGGRYASVIGVDINEAIDKLSRSSLKEREGLMRQMGVHIDNNKVLEDYAKKLGTVVEGLSDVERQSALLNAQVSSLKDAFDLKGINNESLMSPISTAMKQMDTLTQQMTDKIIAKLGVIATAPVTKLLIKIMGGDEDKKQLADLERQVRLNEMIVEKYGEGLSDKHKSLLLEKESLINEQKKRDVIQEQKEQMEKGLIQQQQGDLVSNRTGGNIRKIKDMLKETREKDDLYQAFKKANISTDAMSQHMRMMKIDMELMLENSKKISSGIELAFKPSKDSEDARAESDRVAKERADRIAESNKNNAEKKAKEDEELQKKIISSKWKSFERTYKIKQDESLKNVAMQDKKIAEQMESVDIDAIFETGLKVSNIDEDVYEMRKNKTIEYNKWKKENRIAQIKEETELEEKFKSYLIDASNNMYSGLLSGREAFLQETIAMSMRRAGAEIFNDGLMGLWQGGRWALSPYPSMSAQGVATIGYSLAEIGAGLSLGYAGTKIMPKTGKASEGKDTTARDSNTINQNMKTTQKVSTYLFPSERDYLQSLQHSNAKLNK